VMTQMLFQWLDKSSVGLIQWLDKIWGPHTIDRFASPGNAQFDRFNSRFYMPGAEEVDTFTCSWVEDNNWWVPPVHLVPRVIRHAQNENPLN